MTSVREPTPSAGSGGAAGTAGTAGTATAALDRRTRVLVGVAVVTTVLAWASAFVAIRAVGASVPPGALALGRLALASVVLGGAVLVRRSWVRPNRREWLLILVCGLAWFAVYNVALNAAERHLDAGAAAMLVNVGPILLAVLAGVLLKEGFPRGLLVGVPVAFAGVLLIGFATARGGVDLAGVLLCLLAAVGYAVGMLAQKPALRRLPAVQVVWLAGVVGALACLPAAPDLAHAVTTAPPGALAGLGYLGLVPSALAFSTWAYALRHSSAGRLGVTTYLVPPLTIAGGFLVLGEVPPLLAVAGGVVCLVGVALSRRR